LKKFKGRQTRTKPVFAVPRYDVSVRNSPKINPTKLGVFDFRLIAGNQSTKPYD